MAQQGDNIGMMGAFSSQQGYWIPTAGLLDPRSRGTASPQQGYQLLTAGILPPLQLQILVAEL